MENNTNNSHKNKEKHILDLDDGDEDLNLKNIESKSLFDLLMEEDMAFHLQNGHHEDSLIDSGEGMDI
jgi:hypothetical protein